MPACPLTAILPAVASLEGRRNGFQKAVSFIGSTAGSEPGSRRVAQETSFGFLWMKQSQFASPAAFWPNKRQPALLFWLGSRPERVQPFEFAELSFRLSGLLDQGQRRVS